MRDLQRELEYVRGENENIAQIREAALDQAVKRACRSNGVQQQQQRRRRRRRRRRRSWEK